MPGARIPLVGRREEMAILEDEFARAAAGEFRVVLLSGEAGVVGAVVHLGAIVAPQARIPAGWVAVGDPARSYPPGQAEAIQAGLAETGWSFLPVIFGLDDAGGRRQQLCAALDRYTAALARHHRQDQTA